MDTKLPENIKKIKGCFYVENYKKVLLDEKDLDILQGDFENHPDYTILLIIKDGINKEKTFICQDVKTLRENFFLLKQTFPNTIMIIQKIKTTTTKTNGSNGT